MLAEFFILHELPAKAETGTYLVPLVVLSYLVSSLAAYTALDLASYLVEESIEKKKQRLHLMGAIAMGTGIWSMHFIGMLAYKIDMQAKYDPFLTFISLTIAILVAFFVFELVKGKNLGLLKICLGAVLLGFGICAMHYTGMAAMLMDADLRYHLDLFITSVVIAVTASAAALFIAFNMARHKGKHHFFLKVMAALIMGLAISGMHYTGMEAAVFIPWENCRYAPSQSFLGLAITVASTAFIVIGGSLIICLELAQKKSAPFSDIIGKTEKILRKAAIPFIIFLFLGTTVIVYIRIKNLQIELIKSTSIQEALKMTEGNINDLLFILFGGIILGIGFISFTIRSLRRSEHAARNAEEKLRIKIREKEQLNRQMLNYTNRLEESRIEQEEILQKLISEKTRIRAIMDNVLEGIITINTSGTIVTFNAYAEKTFGYTAHEIIGKSVNILLPRPDKEKHDQYIENYLSTRKAKIIGLGREVIGIRKDGRAFPMALSVTEVEIDGEALFIGLTRDITEEKEKEEELKKAKESAEKASEAKSDFLANMSHEIRTPMNGILGMAGLLLDTPLNSEQRGWAEVIKRSGENLMEIINDILDFSKIEAGKLKLEHINFNLHRAIEDVTDVLNLQAQEKALEFLVDFSSDVPKYVLGDPGRVRQIIFNLAGNAIKFTKKGHVLIKVRSVPDHGQKVRLFFDIEDTGIGIPKDKQKYIFSKFSQGEESTTRKFGGTGLGLSICKSLVDLMNGSIMLESEEGKGSTFSFDILLPLGQEENKSNRIPEISLKNIRTLVIDDNKTSREILHQYLQGWDMRCDLVSSAEKGLSALKDSYEKEDPYRLCLIDYNLSGINGFEFIQAVREHADHQNLAFIMITATGQIASPHQLKRKGLDGFLVKPYQPDHLKTAIQVILNAKQTGQNLDLITRHIISKLTEKDTQGDRKQIKQYESAHILVVEDMKMNLMLIQKILSKHRCFVDVAENGKEAVKKVSRFEYSMVFMDCQMPVVDGFEATQKIRSFEKINSRRQTVIVALTADAMTGDREKCLNIGMNDYMNKPIKAEEVAEMLEKWLGQHS